MTVELFAMQAGNSVVLAVTLVLIVVGVVFVIMGVFGKVKSFGYTYTRYGTANMINGKNANMASIIVGIVLIAIALLVLFG